MKRIPTFFIIITCAALCNAQTYNISGVVKNSAGTGIAGATVWLGQIGMSTTTGTGGNFTITGTSVAYRTVNAVSSLKCPELLQDGRLSFVATHQCDARVMVYDCRGKLRILLREAASSGNNIVSLPRLAEGVYVYHVTVEDKQYTFKGIAGIAANRGPVSARAEKASATTGLAKTDAQFDDVLLATIDGYQMYRLEITNPDTSGIQITLVPLVTGTLTDKDGIVYQTVQIGNQVWTTENIRTTKYNDGTPITKVTDNTAWGDSTAAYCFYNNSNDTAFQHKWGALYNWYTVSSGKLAPAGWRVPTQGDWDTLVSYLTNNGYDWNGALWNGVSAKAMSANTDWAADTTTGAVGNDLTKNNTSGFSALPEGDRHSDGQFSDLDTYAYWWIPSDVGDAYGWYQSMSNSNLSSIQYISSKTIGMAVRLVKVN